MILLKFIFWWLILDIIVAIPMGLLINNMRRKYPKVDIDK